jgi:hypothetical protein
MNREHGGPAEPDDAAEPAVADDGEEPARGRAPNRLIVKLNRERYVAKADVEREATALAAAIPGAEVERISNSGRVLLNLAGDVDPASLAAEVSQREGVDYAEPDVIDRALEAAD